VSICQYDAIDLPEARVELGCILSSVRAAGSDWLQVSVPSGMLGLGFAVTYPLTRAPNPWLGAIDARLAWIAERITIACPFDFTVIEEDAGATTDPPPPGAPAAWFEAIAATGRGGTPQLIQALRDAGIKVIYHP
jgi:hypothetical protein